MIKRAISKTLLELSSSFPVLLVTGSRQTGKTTLLKGYIQKEGLEYLTFDNPDHVLNVKTDPAFFISLHGSPVIFDEVQYVPELFRYIKIAVDENRKNGMFFLTGSQQFNMMANVSESLAGRVGILTLFPLSLRELSGDLFSNPFVPSRAYVLERFKKSGMKKLTPTEIWTYIQRGMYPAIYADNIKSDVFYSSYIKTYIERDVRQLTQVADEMLFLQFIAVAASRTGQLVNYADMARTVGIDPNTAKKWLSILQTSNIVYLLQPYFGNIEKRIVKTPKLYFTDTGLAAYLTKWLTPDTLMSGAMAGAFFETFVVDEVLKSFSNSGEEPPLYFYRDSDGVEIDLLIERNGIIYPVEIKATSSPSGKDAKNLRAARNIKGKELGQGVIICNCNSVGSVQCAGENAMTVPLWLI